MIAPNVHVPYDRIGDYLLFIKENRLNLEIYFQAHTLDVVRYPDLHDLREKLEYGPSFTIHAPFMDLSPGAVDSKVRAATEERFAQVFDVAKVLRPEAIVFHSGYEKWKYSLKTDLWLEKSLLTWKPLLQRAVDMGVKIAIENIFEDEPTNLILLMEKVDSRNFGVCFDAGHFNLFSKLPLKEWLDQLNPWIMELHLHDNNKKAEANGVEFKHVDEDQTFTPEQHDEIKGKMCKLFTPIALTP
jgi:sugar phosphate isomerase/epimerase